MAKRGPKHKFTTPEAFEAKINEYFDECRDNKRMSTVAGLMRFCGFANKCSFITQEKRGAAWADVVGRARLALEDDKWNGGRAIDMFYLKNHHGMRDNHQLDVKADVKTQNVNLNADMDAQQAATLYEQLISNE